MDQPIENDWVEQLDGFDLEVHSLRHTDELVAWRVDPKFVKADTD